MMNSSGLECEVCVVTLKGLKVKEGGFRLNLLKFVSDLMDLIG